MQLKADNLLKSSKEERHRQVKADALKKAKAAAKAATKK
jgi:hypothetical protein